MEPEKMDRVDVFGGVVAVLCVVGLFVLVIGSCGVAEAQEYNAADSYEEIYSVDGNEIIQTPDGPCQRLYWSTYLGKCTKPLDTVTVPEQEHFHQDGDTFKEHFEASRACHAINSWLLESYNWFLGTLGPEHSLTQLYKYSLEASLKGCAR